MATPAAVLSLLVQAKGAQAAAGQIRAVDAAGRKAGGSMKTLESNTKRTNKSLSLLGSTAKTAGALVGGIGLAKGISTMVSEYREAQKVGAQTNAVLKSTGGAAKVTKKHIENLAGSISKKSGIDDEAIQSGENLLLTFTKIRNETGRGNKIFDQATQTITDMSVALGQSGKSSAIQLGKALNDPIKGITALRRVGVSFTADQEKQIKKMVESGDLLGAQKRILKELKTEFGGSAAAQATAGDKLSVSLHNLAEAAGGVLVPVLDKAAVALTNLINDFIEGKGIAKVITPAFFSVRDAIASTFPVFAMVVQWLRTNETVAKVAADALSILVASFALAKGAVVGTAKVLWGFVDALKNGQTWAVVVAGALGGLAVALVTIKTVTLVVAAATRAYAIAQGILNVVMAANPLVALGVVLAVVAGALVALELKTHFVEKAWRALKDAFASVINWIGNAASNAFATVRSAAEKGLLGPVPLIITHWGEILSFFKALPGRIAGFLSSLPGWFVKIGEKIVDAVIQGLGMLGHAILNKFKDAARFVIDNVGGFFKGVGGAITKGVGAINPFGDGTGKEKLPSAGSANLQGAQAALGPFAAIGAKYGLHVSSGRRPGAITSSGNASYHSTGEAIDEAGSPAGMLAYFKYLKSHYGGRLAELIYTPGGVGIKDGKPFRYSGQVAQDHFDHVHVAFDTGRAGVGDGVGRQMRKAGMGDGPGKLGLQALANLWVKAGGSPKLAGLMARIAMAESGGDPNARNPSGATGLWQILGALVKGNLTDPLTNARNAVAKYKSQGLGAWAASRSVWGKYVGHPGVKATTRGGGSGGGQKVNPFDLAMAQAQVALSTAKQGSITIGKGPGARTISSSLRQLAALTQQRGVVSARIKKVRAALKGKLTKGTRLRLTQELGSLLDTHASIQSQIKDLRTPAATTPSPDIGSGDLGGGGDTGAAIEDNTAAINALNDQLAQVNAKLDLQRKATEDAQRAFNTSQSQYGVLAKAIADVASGELGGRIGLGFMTPGWSGGGGVRY